MVKTVMTFDGKRYVASKRGVQRKFLAKAHAKRVRERGNLARTVRVKGGYRVFKGPRKRRR